MSDYTIIIRGPEGVILDAEIESTLRSVRRLALDDDKLKELLVLTSVCGGVVEAECELARRKIQQEQSGSLSHEGGAS